MEALYKLQLNKKSVIEKARINLRKSPKDRITHGYISTRLDLLEQTWDGFLNTHNKIIQTGSLDSQTKDEYFTDEIYEYVEEMYIDYKSELKEYLERLGSSSVKAVQAKSVSNDSVKLPKISIPKFSGHYSEWPTFKDLFESLIHKNESLDDVQRLHYLKGLLIGEAEQLVRHIPVTSSNYEECWTLLKGRYNNKRFLSNSLLKRLMTQGSVTENNSRSVKCLLDTTMECLNGLKNLGIDVTSWDILIIYIMSAKLDSESRKLWETQISTLDELPKLSQFKDFLEARFRALEFLDEKSVKPKPNMIASYSKSKVHHVVNPDNNVNVIHFYCEFCKEQHKISNCKQFAKESYESRQQFIQNSGLCFNCLGPNHAAKFCRYNASCRICKRKHHSLLHPKVVSNSTACNNVAKVSVNSAVSNIQESQSDGEHATSVISHFSKESVSSQVLLATALVKAQSRNGSTQLLRVLLDQGSQASFITEDAVQLLGLEKTPVKSMISGIGGENGELASENIVSVTIHSHLDPSFSCKVKAYVLRNITSLLPSTKFVLSHWPQLETISLADPAYHTPSRINILLGAEVYGQILRDGLIQGPPGFPVAQNTALGWILSGKISTPSDAVNCHHLVVNDLDQIMHLEAKFKKNPELARRYSKVFKEYKDIGHIKRVPRDNSKRDTSAVYISHYAVVREDRLTTKVRIVYDTSTKGLNGVSLNDDISVGPLLQSPLRHIIMKWRMHPISICSDIVKMYRQVKVSSEDTDFQRVIWRDDPGSEIEEYRLLTITFGTASAPYLAMKTLQQTATDEAAHNPKISEIIKRDFYVDNLMTGCQSVQKGIQIYYKEIKEILTRCGFQLQKWVSSCKELDKEISERGEDFGSCVQSRNRRDKDIKCDEVMKILGITWDRECDEFKTTQGPSWLRKKSIEYTRPKSITTNMEQRAIKIHVITDNVEKLPLWTKYSTLQKLVRVKAYYRRVLKFMRQYKNNKRFKECLQSEEIEEAFKVCIRRVQKEEFQEEIKDIKKVGHRKSRSKLKSLCPIIDEEGILRFSGHIEHANLELECMATNAIHLEAIRDLSADGFIAGFKRFVSRRGLVSDNMWSDNGSYFTAAKELRHFVAIEQSSVAEDIREWVGNNGISSLRRWQVTQQMVQNFWKRWSDEYLMYMLQRYKWAKQMPEPNVGDVVLVKEDGLPPARWLMGRVVTKHPGSDQITRVVTLKCNGSLIKRPTSKLCLLPVCV